MRWVSSIATHEDSRRAVASVIDATREQLEDHPPHLLLLFSSPAFTGDSRAILDTLRAELPATVVIGCSAAGVIGGGVEVEQTPALALTAAYLPNVKLLPIYTDTTNLPDDDAPPRAWREAIGIPENRTPHLLLLADPFSACVAELVRGLDFILPDRHIIGGLASGAREPGGNVLYLNDQIFDEGVVAVGLEGDLRVDTIVAQGCRPIGNRLRITACEANVIHAIDGQSPIEYLQGLAPGLNEYDRHLLQTALFIGVQMDALQGDPGHGDYLIRNIMGVDKRNGGLIVAEVLHEGQTVQFHLRDKLSSAHDLESMLNRAARDGVFDDSRGALLFSCLGRGEHLYGRPNHDSELLHKKAGELPVGGFFCNGEIGPVAGSTYIHGYTSAFGIFSPSEREPD